MPDQPRRRWRWIAAAAALAAAGAIAAIALGRDGSSPPAPGRAGSAAAPGSGTAPSDHASPPASGVDQAAQLVAAATASAASGNVLAARGLLERAYTLDPRPATLLELGRIDLQIGRCRDARRAIQGVIAAAPGEPLAGEARELLGKIGRCD